jgi:hypothetical protein
MRLAVTMRLVQARLLELLAQGLSRSPQSYATQLRGWRLVRISGVCAAVLLATGCAGYRLGPVNDETASDKSVEILPFNNQTLEPRLGDAVTQALRQRIQKDGTYHLARSEGDIVVSGVITAYNRAGLSYLGSDVLLDKDVKGYTLVHVGSDLQDAERQAMPLLAGDFARKVTQMLTEGTW